MLTPHTPTEGVAFTVTDLPRHIQCNIIRDDDSGCWLWKRSLSSDGYGWASLNNKTAQAHRLVYRLLRGEPPEGLVLDHLCRVRHCVNPAHLEPVTPRENLLRSENTPAGAKHCGKCGGDFIELRGQRRCPACLEAYKLARREHNRDRERERRRRLKEEAA